MASGTPKATALSQYFASLNQFQQLRVYCHKCDDSGQRDQGR
jgi:hypothetical protein